MPHPDPLYATRIAACSMRLLGVHLDAADVATGDAVAAAVERLADAMVTWHDAVATSDPDHVTPRRPRSGAPISQGGTALEASQGVLDRVAVSSQVAARDLDAIAATVTQHAEAILRGRLGPQAPAEVATRLAEHGQALSHSLSRLAEVVAELGTVAERERSRGMYDDRTTTALARAEHAVRRTADAVSRPTG